MFGYGVGHVLCFIRFTLTLQAAIVLLITMLHIVVVIYVLVMLFSREKFDPSLTADHRSHHHHRHHQQQRQIPMPLTQVVPASSRPSRASHTSGQNKMAAASAAITETWEPHAPPTAKPLARTASRIASQVASEPESAASACKRRSTEFGRRLPLKERPVCRYRRLLLRIQFTPIYRHLATRKWTITI